MRTLLLTGLFLALSGVAEADAPKAITDAIAALEKAALDAKDPAEKAKLREAVEALKKVAAPPDAKPQNELISDFVDNRAKYAGRTLTFKLAYRNRVGPTKLDGRIGDAGVLFVGNDPKNGAELLLGVDLPLGLVPPSAKSGEEVIITFRVGEAKKPNVAIAIRRP